MLPVAAVQIGKQLGILSDAVGAAVILTSFFSMLLAPIGFSILGPKGTEARSREDQESGVPIRDTHVCRLAAHELRSDFVGTGGR
jgi:hypothetical protein